MIIDFQEKTVKTPVDGISPLDFAALQMLQPLWTSSQVYSTWTPAPSCSRLSLRHEKPKRTKHLFLKSRYGPGLHVVIVFLFNSCFLGFACLCCKAVGCLWVSGKKWLCLHKQSLTDGYRQMLTEHAAQTRVLTVLVNSNTALCRWPQISAKFSLVYNFVSPCSHVITLQFSYKNCWKWAKTYIFYVTFCK